MADNNKNKGSPTHTALAIKREGRKFMRWLEIGVARADPVQCPACGHRHAVTSPIRTFLDRLPIGGFTGGVLLSPIGTTPALPEPPPRRPGDIEDDDPLDS